MTGPPRCFHYLTQNDTDFHRSPMSDIVIPRKDLPDVTPLNDIMAGWFEAGGITFAPGTRPAELRKSALAYLAVAEYLEARP